MSVSDDRYQFVELELEPDSVSIIQDTENDSAWLQSTLSVPVER